MESAASFESVSKTYDGQRWILRDVDLQVERGQVVVVRGRSGSGKSTLLNLAAGLAEPTRGVVRVAGHDVAGLDEEQRARMRRMDVGVVFQDFLLVPELTVLENVGLPMRLARVDGWRRRATILLETFDLAGFREAFPSTLSGGERQRVAITRALGNEPDLLLADEPTANLDEDNALVALDTLRSVARVMGAGVLVASHDPLAPGIGDRVVSIAGGRLDMD